MTRRRWPDPRCRVCEVALTEANRGSLSNGYICKPCHAAYHRAWRAAHAEHARAYSADYQRRRYAADPAYRERKTANVLRWRERQAQEAS